MSDHKEEGANNKKGAEEREKWTIEEKETDKKEKGNSQKKDGWDKAAVISSFISIVVIAIFVLEIAVPRETYDKIPDVVLKSDPSSGVRTAAIQQLGNTNNPSEQTTKAIAAVAEDSAKPAEEREEAKRVSDKFEEERISTL